GIVSGSAALVNGWVLDREDAIVDISLLIDDQPLGGTPSRSTRPDVCQAYPTIASCPTSQPGFAFNWNTTSLNDGSHTVAVRVTDPHGTGTILGPITIQVNNTTTVSGLSIKAIQPSTPTAKGS